MKLLIRLISSGIFFLLCACSSPQKHRNIPPGFVFVKGGSFTNSKSNLFGKNAIITDFLIGKYEVSQLEWKKIMNYNPSRFKGDSLPVEMVSWYDCIIYCNKKSLVDGLIPYYQIDSLKKDLQNLSGFDSLKWTVSFNGTANGYRLPTEAEWEYAASGGQFSKSFLFSGSNDINEVAWYWRNSGNSFLATDWNYKLLTQNQCKTNQVGLKTANELGIYDMTGNVREWCEDWYVDHENPKGLYRSQRGGGWIGLEKFSTIANRGNFEANGLGPDQGFRLCMNLN